MVEVPEYNQYAIVLSECDYLLNVLSDPADTQDRKNEIAHGFLSELQAVYLPSLSDAQKKELSSRLQYLLVFLNRVRFPAYEELRLQASRIVGLIALTFAQ